MCLSIVVFPPINSIFLNRHSPILKVLFKASQSSYQSVSRWVMITSRGHLCRWHHRLYLSPWIEVLYKAFWLRAPQYPSAGVMDVVNGQPNTIQRLDYSAVDVLRRLAFVLSLMIAITCTRGIHQHSSVKRVLYGLLPTVNNALMD